MTTLKPSNTLKKTIDAIRKEHGDNSILKLGERADMQVEFNPTCIATVDEALGGGFPKGRVVEIFGHESSAKTTLALYAVAEAQRRGGVCAFLDVEHALNPAWAEMIGIDTKELFISQPNSGEEAFEIALTLAESNELDIVVIDSVSTLIPMAEVEGDMTDSNMGSQARMMSKGMRKLVALDTKTTTIFINQIRNKIGIVYGSPEVTSGGLALKFAASVRIRTQLKGAKGDRIMGTDDVPIGVPIELTVIKNKCAPPFRTARFELYYEKGIDLDGALLDAAVAKGVIVRKGSHYYDIHGEKLGNGRATVLAYFKEHPEAVEKIKKEMSKLYEAPSDDS